MWIRWADGIEEERQMYSKSEAVYCSFHSHSRWYHSKLSMATQWRFTKWTNKINNARKFDFVRCTSMYHLIYQTKWTLFGQTWTRRFILFLSLFHFIRTKVNLRLNGYYLFSVYFGSVDVFALCEQFDPDMMKWLYFIKIFNQTKNLYE